MDSARSTRRSFLAGLCLVLLGAFGFSAKSILVKLAYAAAPELDAIALMALRMLFSLPIFLLAAAWHNRKTQPRPLRRKEWLAVILLGLDGYYLASCLDFYGLQYVSAGLERIILFLYPTFVVLFSAFAFGREITRFMAAALALTYSGMMLVFVEHVSLAAPDLWLGSSLVLGSAVAFAGFTLGSGVMVHRIGSSRFTAYTMSVAGIATLIHFVLERGFAFTGFPDKVYGLALTMTVFSTVLPAFFMNAGIRRIGADAASVVSTIGPIATLVMAFLVLDEAVTPLQSAGTCLVLSGVYVLGRAKSGA